LKPVPPQHSHPAGDDRQVLPFRPRGALPRRLWPLPPQEPAGPADLGRYEGSAADDDNYRHRMLVNLAALAFTIMLATAGAWLAVSIADLRKNQDCYLSGRRNCTPIDVPALQGR
jgi:hypothetical protein